jgi:hypothetical protein
MRERDLDVCSDIYALGAVTYEMLAGEPPVTGPTARAMIAKLMTERPTSLRVLREVVPRSLDDAVMRALAKAPTDRFSNAREFAAALTAPEVRATHDIRARIGAVAGAPRRSRTIALAMLGVVGAYAAARNEISRRSTSAPLGADTPTVIRFHCGPSARQLLGRFDAGVLRRRDDR